MITSCPVINKLVRLKPKGLPEAARALVEPFRCLQICAAKVPFLFWCTCSALADGQSVLAHLLKCLPVLVHVLGIG